MRSWCLLVSLLLSLPAAAKVDRPPQFVLLAFDGSKSLSFWQNSLQFADQNNLHFTYFISGVYFVTDAQKNNYVEPSRGPGKSAIGFGGDVSTLQNRIRYVQAAVEKGHDIASHANAHFDGTTYTESQWDSENSQFTKLLVNSWKNYGLASQQPQWWDGYFNHTLKNELGMVGFRAPLLGVGKGLWPSLAKNGILYDTSRVDQMSYWPQKINGIWNFPLVGLKIVDTGKKTLSMDYNFYVADSKGVAGPASQYSAYEDRMFRTYLAYFNTNYFGNRAPVHIGHHFSLWNGGAYWNAMQRLAKAVCSKPEVVCGTYKDLLHFVENNQDKLSSYKAGDFDKATMAGREILALKSRGLPTLQELSPEELSGLQKEATQHFSVHDEAP